MFRRLDLGIDLRVHLEQVQQVAARQKFQWLVFGEFKGCLAESRGSNKDALRCALIMNTSEKVADGAYGHRILVAFCLNNDLPAEYCSVVEGNAVNAAVP